MCQSSYNYMYGAVKKQCKAAVKYQHCDFKTLYSTVAVIMRLSYNVRPTY